MGKEAETVNKGIIVHEQYALQVDFFCEESLSAFPKFDRESKTVIPLTK